MADAIIPQTPTLRFTATPGVYQLAPEVSTLDLLDQLSARQLHLHSMLAVGGESSLDCLADTLPGYFWACRVAAEEIRDLTAELIRRNNLGPC